MQVPFYTGFTVNHFKICSFRWLWQWFRINAGFVLHRFYCKSS